MKTAKRYLVTAIAGLVIGICLGYTVSSLAAIVFPTSLDSFTDQTATDVITYAKWNDLQHGIEACEAKIGVDSSAITSSLDYLVKSTSSSNPGHKHTLANGASNVTSTYTQLNYLSAATGTTGTTTGNVVFSVSPTFTGTPVLPTPFTIGAISMTATGTELNWLAAGNTEIGDLITHLKSGSAMGVIHHGTSGQVLTTGGHGENFAWATPKTYKCLTGSGSTSGSATTTITCGFTPTLIRVTASEDGEDARYGSEGNWCATTGNLSISGDNATISTSDIITANYWSGHVQSVTSSGFDLHITENIGGTTLIYIWSAEGYE